MPPSTPEDLNDLFGVAASASASAPGSAHAHDPISGQAGMVTHSLVVDPSHNIDYSSSFPSGTVLDAGTSDHSSAVNTISVNAAGVSLQSQHLHMPSDTLAASALGDGEDSTDNEQGSSSRKRGLPATNSSNIGEDKKARERKRIMRNRELARVSNERRKGRIKAMEAELDDTRQTVASLEESIRTLEAENSELKTLLENKS